MGRGSFIAIPDTSTDSTFTITSTYFYTNTAKTSGGLFYMGGTGIKNLYLTSTNISVTQAQTGSGGIAYMAGTQTHVTVVYTTLASTALLKNNQALGGDGGLFYSNLNTLVGTSCNLEITLGNIDTAVASGRGGIMFCTGKGTSTVKIAKSSLKTTSGKAGGGMLYISMLGGDV